MRFSPKGVVYEHREGTFGDNVDTSEVGKYTHLARRFNTWCLEFVQP